MIQANDLRLDNWVEHDGRVFQIDCLTKDAPFLNTEEFGVGIVSYKNINGIQLDKEILEGCGFVEKEKNYWIREDYSMINTMGGWHFDYVDADHRGDRAIAYPQNLHHLQNVVHALTGQELTVNLPINT